MRQVTFFLLISFFMVSCIADFVDNIDKIGEPYVNPQIGAPVLSGTFTLGDYIDATSDEVSISQDNDGLVIIEYSGDPIESDYAEDLIEIPAQSFNQAFSFSNAQTVNLPITGTISRSISIDETITVENGTSDVLDSLYLKEGTLRIEAVNNIPADVEAVITINTLKVGGEPISVTANWTYDPANPGTQTMQESISLVNAFGDFTKGGTASNNFNFDVDLTVTYSNQVVSGADNVIINVDIENPKFQLLYGKFSEREFETDAESVALGIFDEIAIDGFYLDQPRIEFDFLSSYGIPVETTISQLDAMNKQGQVMAFTGDLITNPTQIVGPGLDEIGETILTSLVLDKTNSNITDIISFLPSQIDYQITGKVLTPSPTLTQFVLDTSRVMGEYRIILPLDGSVARFESEQSFDDLELEDLDFLGEALIRIKSINGLPITVGLEVVFIDEFDNEIMTLFKDEKALEPGEVDNNGFVISPTENTLETTLSEEQVKDVFKARRAVIKTILNTGETGSEVVKFRVDDEVHITMYVQSALTIFE